MSERGNLRGASGNTALNNEGEDLRCHRLTFNETKSLSDKTLVFLANLTVKKWNNQKL